MSSRSEEAEMVGLRHWRSITNVEKATHTRIAEAIGKHGLEQTPLSPAMDPMEKLTILVEEVGEVAKALTYDNRNGTESRATLCLELEQVIAVATMWRASL